VNLKFTNRKFQSAVLSAERTAALSKLLTLLIWLSAESADKIDLLTKLLTL
jgi:hypothetical protein